MFTEITVVHVVEGNVETEAVRRSIELSAAADEIAESRTAKPAESPRTLML